MPLTDDPWLPYNTDGTVSSVLRAAPVAVFRYDGVSTLFPLPNVECLSISMSEGTDPGSARFRYNLASGIDGAPISIETALGTGYSGSYIVNADGRLVVQAADPSGNVYCLFDGLAVDFGMGLDPDIEEVQIGAIGIGSTAFDYPISGAYQRNAGAARSIADTATDLIAQFNPDGLPNCTPDGFSAGFVSSAGDFRYPTFLDPRVIQSPDNRTYWTLSKACRYILFNPEGPLVSNPYLFFPSGTILDNILVSPGTNGDTSAPINCPDTPITGKDWPGTIHRLVSDSGFGTAFVLTTQAGGLPLTTFNIFANQSGTAKSLYLAPRGTNFDARLFNFNASSIHRDISEVVNQIVLVGGRHRWEASFILAPGFPMQSTDSSQGNLTNYDANSKTFTANRNSYRLYIFDECSDGHYAVGSATEIPLAPSLDGLFGKGQYARHRLPGIGTLISVDPLTNRPYNARLSISTNYDSSNNKGPGLWDGTGTWQNVAGGWRLLHDRLGIEITDFNPNRWNVGDSQAAGDPFPVGMVYGVERQATFVNGQSFVLRLTCVVEADQALVATATPTGTSPVARTISRTIDASDRMWNEYVDYPSEFNATGGNDLNPRNANPAALAEAQAMRSGQSNGMIGGSVVIPRLTTYYQIGDLISQIEGRNLGFVTNQSGQAVYPVVVGVTYTLGPDAQATTLELSDAGTLRRRYRRPPARRKGGRYATMPAEHRSERTGYEAGYMNRSTAAPGGYQPPAGDDSPSPWG